MVTLQAARSEKLLQAIAKHLGGAETDTLLEDTAASDVKEQDDVREKLLAERASKVASSRSSMAHSGSLKDRAKQVRCPSPPPAQLLLRVPASNRFPWYLEGVPCPSQFCFDTTLPFRPKSVSQRPAVDGLLATRTVPTAVKNLMRRRRCVPASVRRC